MGAVFGVWGVEVMIKQEKKDFEIGGNLSEDTKSN